MPVVVLPAGLCSWSVSSAVFSVAAGRDLAAEWRAVTRSSATSSRPSPQVGRHRGQTNRRRADGLWFRRRGFSAPPWFRRRGSGGS